jgi:predicted NUDIX family phosphoesterase
MKKAMYINANNLTVDPFLCNPGFFSVPIPFAFFSQSFHLGDRDLIETDESKLQVIPYVNLLDSEGRVFCYSRGKGSDEARLHSALSIGLGGHIDAEPPTSVTAWQWFKMDAVREVAEEVGLPSNVICLPHLLFDRSSAVGRVHLGVRCIAVIKKTDAKMAQEHGVIEHGSFRHLDSFTEEEVSRMEPWSKLCLMRLAEENGLHLHGRRNMDGCAI